MNIVINPTPLVSTIDGCDIRQYDGITEDGIRCHVLVAGLIPCEHADADRLRAKFDTCLASAPMNRPSCPAMEPAAPAGKGAP